MTYNLVISCNPTFTYYFNTFNTHISHIFILFFLSLLYLNINNSLFNFESWTKPSRVGFLNIYIYICVCVCVCVCVLCVYSEWLMSRNLYILGISLTHHLPKLGLTCKWLKKIPKMSRTRIDHIVSHLYVYCLCPCKGFPRML